MHPLEEDQALLNTPSKKLSPEEETVMKVLYSETKYDMTYVLPFRPNNASDRPYSAYRAQGLPQSRPQGLRPVCKGFADGRRRLRWRWLLHH